jgi:hypothetical protein
MRLYSDHPPAAPAAFTDAHSRIMKCSPPTLPRLHARTAAIFLMNEFRGCLGCGGADHIFRSCPRKDDPETKDRFHRNFNAKFDRPDRPPARRQPSSHGGRIGSRSVMAIFDADTRPVAEVPNVLRNRPLDFRTL